MAAKLHRFCYLLH